MAITIEQIMEQAQVYASAWSLVGGVFDQGNQLQLAEEEKERLEEMLEDFQEETDTNAAPGNLKEIAEGLVQWHQKRLATFDTLLNTPKDTEVRLDTGDEEPLVLNGEVLRGFRIGLMIAREWVAKFPLSIQRTAPDSGEEE